MIDYYSNNNKFDEAMQFADDMLAKDPNNTFYLYVKGYLYHNMKDYEKAIEFYNKTIEVDPNYAEAYSNHPIAQSIRNAYGKQIDTKRLSKYEEFAGNGVCVYFDEDELMIGNHRFMETNNINCPVFDHTGTIVYVSKNKSVPRVSGN